MVSVKPITNALKGLYFDPNKWDFVKSLSMFAIGIYIVKTFKDVRLTSSLPQ
ncbi:hypothetical protein WDU94_004624 [Cyamophila willieti]